MREDSTAQNITFLNTESIISVPAVFTRHTAQALSYLAGWKNSKYCGHLCLYIQSLKKKARKYQESSLREGSFI